jgi:hypothetical protein
MSAKHDEETKVAVATGSEEGLPPYPPQSHQDASVQEDQAYVYDDSQKLGYTATVFIILNKMIGTGSTYLSNAKCAHLTSTQSSPPRRGSSLSPDPSVSLSSSGSSVAS